MAALIDKLPVLIDHILAARGVTPTPAETPIRDGGLLERNPSDVERDAAHERGNVCSGDTVGDALSSKPAQQCPQYISDYRRKHDRFVLEKAVISAEERLFGACGDDEELLPDGSDSRNKNIDNNKHGYNNILSAPRRTY